MAEIATIARPYAEALFKADGIADLGVLADELQALADVAGEAQLRQFADNPKVTAEQVFDLVTSVARPDGSAPLSKPVTNLLRMVIENGRLVALPEIAAQYHALVTGRSGTPTLSSTAPFRSGRSSSRTSSSRSSGASAASSTRAS